MNNQVGSNSYVGGFHDWIATAAMAIR
jgi:hypothetical protein